MSSVFDYLKWRKDLDFNVSPFNNVDNLVLSQLSYAFWDNIVDEKFSNQISLKDAINRFYAIGNDVKQIAHGYFSSDNMMKSLNIMIDSNRYRDIKLCGFRQNVNYDNEEQFAALTMVLPDGTILVLYRGTDDSILGWKEDFNMSFKSTVPGQISAKEYLHDALIAFKNQNVIVAGHSKGGNFAVYASAFIPSVLQKRVLTVYNNDGPGFMKEIIESEGYQNIYKKINTFVPQSSIIGMILEHEEEFKIIKSNQMGILQHDVYSWEIDVTDFEYVDENKISSKVIDKSLKNWVNDLSFEEKQKFIDTVFKLIQETGIESPSQLRNAKLKSSYTMWRNYNELDDNEKELIKTGLDYLLKSLKSNVPSLTDELKKQITKKNKN